MIRPAALFGLALACGCGPQAGQETNLIEPPQALYAEPERPLPVLGRIDATYGGATMLWQTLDFSVGAIDPSANIGSYQGTVSIFVGGHLPGQDFDEMTGRLEIRADLPQGAAPGAAGNVVIAVIDTPGYDAPREVSGAEATLVITEVTPPADEGEVYGTLAGRFAARLCRAASREAMPDPADCLPIEGSFSTSASFEGMR